MIYVVFALFIFIFQIVTILILEFRNPSKTVAWLLILFIFPIIGFVMYYFLAKEYKQRRKVSHKGNIVTEETRKYIDEKTKIATHLEYFHSPNEWQQRRLFSLLLHIPDSPITLRNRTEVLTNGEAAYGSMMETIRQARDHIHLEFYTIRSDRIGRRFQKLLLEKATEGVKVRVIYDGVGSYDLKGSYLDELHDAGIEVRCFLPPFIALFDKRMNYRNHRKIVVVDGRVGYLGGINIGDEYLGHNKKLGFWRDTHLKLSGDAVYHIQHTFLTDWAFVSGQRLTDSKRYFPSHGCEGVEPVQIIASGPDTDADGIFQMVFAAIAAADRRIYITSPYFIPDRSLAIALKTAAISGVDVRIIIPAVPDTWVVYWASLSYLEDLMQAGVRFFLYQKGFIHSKVMLIDHVMASVGTANMDLRSFFSNFELNAVLFDPETINRLEADFILDLKSSRELIQSEFEKRPKSQKAKEVLSRMLSPLL